MKKKSMWGVGIVISFIVFGICILAVVYIAMSTKVDLVADDYYAKELKYQDHIDIVKNTGSLTQDLELSFTPSTVNILFPKLALPSDVSGTIYFFRPSDKSFDFYTEILIDSTYMQKISTQKIPKGMWKVKISWSAGSQKYYFEQPVILQ